MSADARIVALAKRLVAARERLGVSQTELGASVGVHKETISRLERGLQDPGLLTVLDLAEALGTSLSELAGELEPRGKVPKLTPVVRRLLDVVEGLPVKSQRALLEVAELLRRER